MNTLAGAFVVTQKVWRVGQYEGFNKSEASRLSSRHHRSSTGKVSATCALATGARARNTWCICFYPAFTVIVLRWEEATCRCLRTEYGRPWFLKRKFHSAPGQQKLPSSITYTGPDWWDSATAAVPCADCPGQAYVARKTFCILPDGDPDIAVSTKIRAGKGTAGVNSQSPGWCPGGHERRCRCSCPSSQDHSDL